MISSLLLLAAAGPTNVDMALSPSSQALPAGCIAEVELILSADSLTAVTAVDAILAWDPSKLAFLEAVPSSAGWLIADFLTDPDGINTNVFDGDALFTALASPLAPPTVPPDVLVATFRFQVLGEGEVALLPALGALATTKVVGLTPGLAITGALSGSAAIHELDAPASEVLRAGSPPNPLAFQPGVSGAPVLGSLWSPFIDHTSFVPAATVDLVVFSLTPTNVPIAPFGTLLCLPPVLVPAVTSPSGVPFAIGIPDNCVFAGVEICTQGVSLDAFGGIFLANAIDITLGTR